MYYEESKFQTGCAGGCPAAPVAVCCRVHRVRQGHKNEQFNRGDFDDDTVSDVNLDAVSDAHRSFCEAGV